MTARKQDRVRAALRSYRRAMGHLAPRQDAVWGEGEATVPIGQYTANLRRKGTKNGLGKDEDITATRAAQLAEINEDWNCPWPLGWSGTTAVLAVLVDADGSLPEIQPGVLFEGGGFSGRRTRALGRKLLSEWQERLSKLGVQPTETPSPAPAAARTTGRALSKT